MKIKDHFLSQKIFEVIPSKYKGILETYPQPTISELPKYYDSSEYISHQTKANTLKGLVYQKVKSVMINRKRKWVYDYNTSGHILDIGSGTGDFLNSFKHYDQGNFVHSNANNFEIEKIESFVESMKEIFTVDFFKERTNFGIQNDGPIFVLGLHRSGSTLTEQILSSHTEVEGTYELPFLNAIVTTLSSSNSLTDISVDTIKMLESIESEYLASKYIEFSDSIRQTRKIHYIDKMPVNWMYIGLIHLLLPNSKIIDIRRAPMAACFANFKMHFGSGSLHTYNQEHIARYYVAYVSLMEHIDSVLPGRIFHMSYEELVDNTEDTVARLLAYCNLDYQESCLEYWKTSRDVFTPSSEQVRKPIYKEAKEQWKNYAEFLGPMKEVLEKAGMRID